MAREHPFERNYGAAQTRKAKGYESEQEMPNSTRVAFA